MKKKIFVFLIMIQSLVFFFVGCNKLVEDLVEIPPPISSIDTDKAFIDSANATAAVNVLYSDIANSGTNPRFLTAQATQMGSLLADELHVFSGDISPLETNSITSTESSIGRYWNAAYAVIYQANACIEGLTKSKTLKEPTKLRLLSEAKTLRAIYYLYLITFYGDVPLVTTTDWKLEAIKARTPKSDIYNFIKKDLEFSIANGHVDYSTFNNERAKVTKWLSVAILARVCAYSGEWSDVVKYTTNVIDEHKLYSLESNLNSVYKRNSKEVIMSFAQDVKRSPFNVTLEGRYFTKYNKSRGGLIDYYLDSTLIQEFESNDGRFTNWVGQYEFDGRVFYYPNKYKMGRDEQVARAEAEEHAVFMRLSEMYLLRAEAKFRMGDIMNADSDINVIRLRAGLAPISSSGADQLFAALVHEKRVEFFAEYGHRWFDLNRWGLADLVLAPIKPKWTSNAKLMPIPFDELTKNPSLTQNPGY